MQTLVNRGRATTQAGGVRMTAWRQQLRRAGTAERLQELVLNPPEEGPWVWSTHWTALRGENLPQVLVLAARRSGWRLIELQKHLDSGSGPGPSTFSTALSQASA
ncbi:MAG: hypothetical protein ACK559_40870, partial [bacterium]